MTKHYVTTNTTTEVVVMSKMKEGRYDGTRTGDKKTFSANLQLNSYNVRTEIWPDMRHTNMKLSE